MSKYKLESCRFFFFLTLRPLLFLSYRSYNFGSKTQWKAGLSGLVFNNVL
jgi:hypothetical protein